MIKISVVSYNNETLSESLTAVFGPAGASIGRSNDNFMVLQDPKRYVSRVQASVKSDGSRHSIVNLSQANPILVNGEEIVMGQDVELRIGDEIQIGLYLLKTEFSAEHVAPAKSDARNGAFIAPFARGVPSASGSSSNQPIPEAANQPAVEVAALDLSSLGGSDNDPFADLLGGAVNISAAAQPAAVPVYVAPIASSVGAVSAPSAPAPSATQKGVDPLGFDDLLGTPSMSTTPTSASDPLGLDALLGTSASSVIHPSASSDRSPSVNDNPFGFDDLLRSSSHTPLSPERKAAIIPDDFDPFAMPSAAPRNTHDPLAGMLNGDVSLESIAGNKTSIDGLMSSTDALAGPSLLDPVALGPAHASETDPLALFASESILPTKQDDKFLGDVASNHVSELNSHFAMPQARQENTPVKLAEIIAPPLPVQSAPSSVVVDTGIAPSTPAPNIQAAAPEQKALDGHALAEAFLRGANLPLDTIPSGVTLDWMEMMGRFVATATDGAVELIASRALVKREVKADLTMIVVRNNNPLKFLPDGQSALIQMLGKKIPGFMNPVEAMQDAYIDLRAHQIGVVAGMRAALDEVLRRFDPAMLEKKLKTRTLIDSLVAANRKAKMWDLYGELFKDIYVEAQDDFQTLFGKAFLTAYENEIEHFRQGSKS
jgi:FHA domain-containing protein